MEEKIYTLKEAANRLGCSVRTIRRRLDNLDKNKLSRLVNGQLCVKAEFFNAVKELDQKKTKTKVPKQKNDSLTLQIETLKAELEKARQANEKQDIFKLLQNLNSKVSEHLEGEVKRLQAQNDNLHQRLTNKDSDLKALMSKVVALQEAKETLTKEVGQLQLTSGESNKEQGEILKKLQDDIAIIKQQPTTQKPQNDKEITFQDGQRFALIVAFLFVLVVLVWLILSN